MENQTPVTPAAGNMPATDKFKVKFDGKKLTNQLGAIICECVPELPEASNYAGNYKVRMQQIESIVNMHDELIETLKDATRFVFQNVDDCEKSSLWMKCAQLLKKAEQK